MRLPALLILNLGNRRHEQTTPAIDGFLLSSMGYTQQDDQNSCDAKWSLLEGRWSWILFFLFFSFSLFSMIPWA
jgi:hypothetical protein